MIHLRHLGTAELTRSGDQTLLQNPMVDNTGLVATDRFSYTHAQSMHYLSLVMSASALKGAVQSRSHSNPGKYPHIGTLQNNVLPKILVVIPTMPTIIPAMSISYRSPSDLFHPAHDHSSSFSATPICGTTSQSTPINPSTIPISLTHKLKSCHSTPPSALAC